MNIIKNKLARTCSRIKLLSTTTVAWQSDHSAEKCNKETTKDTFYVTTPIYYVNSDPHIGHLYSSAIADAICRWRYLSNKNIKLKFSTGTDEHGLKIQQAATVSNSTPSAFCDGIVSSYKNLTQEFDIKYTDFVRTTDNMHLDTVNKFWKVLEDNGCIYCANYEGWYCVSDETFLSSSQLKEIVGVDGKKMLISEESGHPVEWTKEKNYLFKLSGFQDDLIYWLKKNENCVKPKKFHKILLDSISKEPLPDVSVSRPSSRVSWGIPVPSDPTQTIYVWLDALVNYLTAAGYAHNENIFRDVWPPDVQVIGKDILKFHGIYWPAFLFAAKLEPPSSLLCHSHWTVASEKMSKSRKNVVDPFDRANIYTNDGLRYFLLRVGVAHSDGNYSDTKVIRILNAELADTLGNLLNRCTSTTLNPKQEIPKFTEESWKDVIRSDVAKQLIGSVSELPAICTRHYNDYNFYKAVDAIVATLHYGNLFFESMKPWELKKNPSDCGKLNVVLHITFETLRVVGTLLQPVIPTLSKTLLDKLNIEEDARYLENLQTLSWCQDDFCSRNLSSDKVVLFRRILLEDKKKVVQINK